jgi:predicted lysophospholipase L1 biosynthesis ABC-type transport system permease subunit
MPTFPLPPPKFRTAGFPQYGFRPEVQTRPSQQAGLASPFVLSAASWFPALCQGRCASEHLRGYLVRGVAFVIRRPRAGSAGLRRELEQAVGSVNPSLAVAEVQTLGTVYDSSLARASFTLALLAVAAGMALLFGVVGIYGVVSYSVSQRNREIGIRLAMGARFGQVIGLFVRHGLAVSGIGVACGLAVALVLTRLMKSLLFAVSPLDPLTYVAALAGLILAAALASYLPARRATRVDPAEALRVE